MNLDYQPNIDSYLHAGFFLKGIPFWYREPGLYLPLSCAIGFDAVGSGPSTSTNALSWSHTFTGSNLCGLIGFLTNGTVSSVTVNSVNATLITSSVTNNASFTNYLYYILGPSTGSQTVQINLGASSTVCGASVSYTGVGSLDNSASIAVITTTNFVGTLVPIADNCWVPFLAQNLTGVVSAVSGCTLRQAASGQNFGMFDNNAAVSPAASTNETVTCGSLANWNGIIASLAPLGSPVFFESMFPEASNKAKRTKSFSF